MRTRVGVVLGSGSVDTLAAKVESMLSSANERGAALAELRHQVIYNFGDSSRAGAAIIARKLGHGLCEGAGPQKGRRECQLSMSP